MLFDEAPRSDRRSIPPVSRPSPPPDGKSGWLPILFATCLASVGFAATHAHGWVAAQGAGFDPDKPRPVLITEAARRPSPEPGHRSLPAGAIVPHSAVVDVHGTPTVFVSDTDYRFVATPVVLGESAVEGRRIVSGVKVGDVVVTDGAEALKAELVLQ